MKDVLVPADKATIMLMRLPFCWKTVLYDLALSCMPNEL